MKNKEPLLHFGLLILRVLTGAGMTYHGCLILFSGKMNGFVHGVSQMGFPLPHFFAWAAVLSEFAGGVFLMLGFYTRAAAFFIFVTMMVAFFIRHAEDAFAVKELALVYGTAAVSLMLTGPGLFSVDSRKS